jgi:hypothetical protein
MTSGIGVILLGAFFTLIGCGKASVSKDPVANAAVLAKWGKLFRIIGPILVLGGIGILILGM